MTELSELTSTISITTPVAIVASVANSGFDERSNDTIMTPSMAIPISFTILTRQISI